MDTENLTADSDTGGLATHLMSCYHADKCIVLFSDEELATLKLKGFYSVYFVFIVWTGTFPQQNRSFAEPQSCSQCSNTKQNWLCLTCHKAFCGTFFWLEISYFAHKPLAQVGTPANTCWLTATQAATLWLAASMTSRSGDSTHTPHQSHANGLTPQH